MHGPQHGSDELVDSETLLDERYECRDLAFVGRRTPEAVEDEFLEGFNLVLEGHEVHDGFVSTSQHMGLWS